MTATLRGLDRRAKIMATLGPASQELEVIRALFRAGLDVVRLNLSPGTHEWHRETIRRVRTVADEERRYVPVVLDLMGPRYRLGVFEGRPHLETGSRVRLSLEDTGEPSEASEIVDLPVERGVLEHLRPGERLLIDNGLVELRVETQEPRAVTARVETGGYVSSRKGLNLPDSQLPFTISEKDDADIRFAVEEDVDYLAASYVGAASHVQSIRQRVQEAGGDLPLVAKLERSAAVEDLEDIVAASDALMVARGDLGVEVPLPRVPVLQKQIIDTGRRAGRPVIVATQMLESMIEQPRPTRAEATDVANAVFDGADALMLSGETAAGHHPVAAVETMARIMREAEGYPAGRRAGLLDGLEEKRTEGTDHLASPEDFEIPDLVATAAVHVAARPQVRWVVAFSQGGFTARLIARHRPDSPILVFTTDDRVARKIQLVWGVRPHHMQAEVVHHDEVVELVERELLARELAQPGEVIVILMGDPIPAKPLTNLMRLHRIAAREEPGGARGASAQGAADAPAASR
jgi:pyruvate kinase